MKVERLRLILDWKVESSKKSKSECWSRCKRISFYIEKIPIEILLLKE